MGPFNTTTMGSLTTPDPTLAPIMPNDIEFDNLYPAIVECFAIIFCGYVAGRMNIISETEAKGLNTFVGTFSLPSLIFMSMATLNFSSVNWHFLLAILLAKTIVFLSVLVITLFVTRPVDMSKSGLFAIFCTQSNDFALGYPIVAALYSKSHPEYPSYLYLTAPISLVVLNPIAFLFMELGKRKEELNRNELMIEPSPNTENSSDTNKKESGASLALSILAKVLFNPVVLMTTLGIVGNFIFHHSLPVILEGILKVFGSAFSAAALFMLGLRMVGKMHKLKGANLVVPCILISVKCLVLPLITRELVTSLQAGADANETLDLSNYGFLYGTFPTAPSVFVFSTQFNIDSDLIASAMVACTFLSAPLMFISAKMVTLTNLNPVNYINELDSFLFDISIISLISTVWVIAVFLLSKKWKKIPHFFTLCLVISQFFGCLGVLLWSTLGCCDQSWQIYLQFLFITMGVFSSRIWTALLALTLYFLRTRSLCFVLKLRPVFALIGWGVPAIIAGVLLSTVGAETSSQTVKADPNFQYGRTQAIVALILLTASFLVTVTSLILQQRYGKRYSDYQTVHVDEESDANGESANTESTVVVRDIEDQAMIFNRRRDVSVSNEASATECPDNPNDDETRFLLTGPTSEFCNFQNCDSQQQQDCAKVVERYRALRHTSVPEEVAVTPDSDEDEYQNLRHVVLLLILSCSMFVGIAICLWTIIMEQPSGIYLELLFLDGVLNYGQGFFVCMVFGFDTKLIVAPIMKKWRNFRQGAQSLVLPRWDVLDPETKHICEQFLSYHIDKCMRDLVRDRRWRLKWYRSVFLGTELVDWLILVGLAHDRSQGLRYGRHLLAGRLIRHIGNEYHFHDQPFFYTFLPSET